jgi:hypothetical protein
MIQLSLLSFKVGIPVVIRHDIQKGIRPMRDANGSEWRLQVDSDMMRPIVDP